MLPLSYCNLEVKGTKQLFGENEIGRNFEMWQQGDPHKKGRGRNRDNCTNYSGIECGCPPIRTGPEDLGKSKIHNPILEKKDGVMGKAQKLDFDSSVYLIKSKVNILTFPLRNVRNLEHCNYNHFSLDIFQFLKIVTYNILMDF